MADDAQNPAPLPKLSAQDFKTYNHCAEVMDQFHDNFRRTWKTLYDACLTNKRPRNLTLSQFLRLGLNFCSSLETHHSIEERFIFPHLAKRMPAFKNELELVGQHRQIHKGLEVLEGYLEECRSGETELRLSELKGILDGFGKVLWEHLDEEVRELGAENMRRFWSVEEMRGMPF
ncbi:hypothetical protein FQN51_002807 [Onygenales sp. PD_10]|nr:hypothetical protein FQN51_002807 [Onygenales sp. PD_10]